MIATTIPKEMSENLARAKAYLKRDDCLRSMEAAAAALEFYARTKIVGKAKSMAEVNFREYINELARHGIIRAFFLSRGITKEPFIIYKAGQEEELAKALRALFHALEKVGQQAEKAGQKKEEQERNESLKKGLELVYTEKEKIRGRAMLRRHLDIYGQEEGVMAEIAGHFLKAALPLEAAELYEQAMENFPKDARAYLGAIEAYTALGDNEKVEKTYLRIIKAFGPHPKTYLNMSKFYLGWHKKLKAYDYALWALQGDENLKEAQEIMDKIDKRI